MAGAPTRQYGGGIIIALEYKPAAAGCLSRGAREVKKPQRKEIFRSGLLLGARGLGVITARRGWRDGSILGITPPERM